MVSAYVDHTLGMAKVTFNPELVTVPLLIEAVARAGGDGRHEYRARRRVIRPVPSPVPT